MANTSLADQLRTLRTPQTSTFIEKKKKLSLLFDSAEAANISISTFYEIGLSGLKELIEINPAVFAEYESSLFDETSKHYERSVQDEEANRKLNEILDKFFYTLSPYYLLKPSQKVIEWLIARFRINEFNADHLLFSVLPYHGTKLFARMLQVFDFRFLEKWSWLQPAQKKGVPLAKSSLMNRCATDLSFTKMICACTVKTCRIFDSDAGKLSTLFGFYTTTIVGALQQASAVSDKFITVLLPSIRAGLSSTSVDFVAASFIILAAIFSKVKLREELTKILEEKITRVNHEKLRFSVVLLLNIMHQSENSAHVVVSDISIENILKEQHWFVPTLAEFVSRGVYHNKFFIRLTSGVLHLAEASRNEMNHDGIMSARNFAQNLLDSSKLDPGSASRLIKATMKAAGEDSSEWFYELVRSFERQYPEAWDAVVSDLLMAKSGDCSPYLRRILGLTSIAPQISVFERLNHPTGQVRAEAVKYVCENADQVKMKYMENSLDSRWSDDDPAVVQAMFHLPSTVKAYGVDVYTKLLKKCWHQGGNWNVVLELTIEKLSLELAAEDPDRLLVFLLPFFVTGDEKVKAAVMRAEHPFFKVVQKELMGCESASVAISRALCSVESSLPNADSLLILYDELEEERVDAFTLVLFMSQVLVEANCKSKLNILAFAHDHILPLQQGKKGDIPTWEDTSLRRYYESLKATGLFPREILHKFAEKAAKSAQGIREFKGSHGWRVESTIEDDWEVACAVYKFLITSMKACSGKHRHPLVDNFLKNYFKSLKGKLHFLCNMCIVYIEDWATVSETLNTMESLLVTSKENYSSWLLVLDEDNIIVPTILVCLFSKNASVRESSINVLKELSACVSLSSNASYLDLMKHVAKYEGEIKADRNQLAAACYEFLSQESHVQSLLPPKTKLFTRCILEALIKCTTGVKTPVVVTSRLLAVLKHVNCPNSVELLVACAHNVLLPKRDAVLGIDEGEIVTLVMDKCNRLLSSAYKLDCFKNFMHYCLQNDHTKIRLRQKDEDDEDNGPAFEGSLPEFFFKKIRDAFDDLDTDTKEAVFDTVVTACEANAYAKSAASTFFKKIKLDCHWMTPYLEEMRDTASQAADNSIDSLHYLPAWRKGVALLEFCQGKKKMTSCASVVPILFDILRACDHMDDEAQVEYEKQLLLSCALNCAEKMEISQGSALDVTSVVDCLRASRNPQTHRHALALLSHCAQMAPKQVVCNMMAIFAFMGSSVLRQDDAFSFQIISNILETIVPLLVHGLKKVERGVENNGDRKKGKERAIWKLLAVFARSIPDIPEHRRVPLLMKLMKVLKDGAYLDVFANLALQFRVKAFPPPRRTAEDNARFLETMTEICTSFPATTVLAAICGLSRMVNSVPNVVHEEEGKPLSEFVSELRTNKESSQYKYMSFRLISSILSDSCFVNKTTTLEEKDDYPFYFQKIFEQILSFVDSFSAYVATNPDNSPQKYHKVMISYATQILNKVNALMTNECFLMVMEKFLDGEEVEGRGYGRRRKILEFYNWRLQREQQSFRSHELTSSLKFLFPAVESIAISNDDDQNLERKLYQQSALICLKLIARQCDSVRDSQHFQQVLDKLCLILNEVYEVRDVVLANLVLCIAELTHWLKIRAIQSLNSIIPAFVTLLLTYEKENVEANDVVLLSVISALHKIVDCMANFLSPYLESILYAVSSLTSVLQHADEKSILLHKLKSVRLKVSTDVPSRVLLPSISACLSHAWDTREYRVAQYLMESLADHFRPNSDFSPDLISLFLSALEFRCGNPDVPLEEAAAVEDYIICSLCRIILKCSESTFRPFYHKLYDWGVINAKQAPDRIITYYRVLSVISERLKSIFVLFASNFVRNAAELLDKNNVSKCDGQVISYFGSNDKSTLLVDAVMKTLGNVFKYDTIKFLTKDRFNTLLEPLVNQIENTIGDYEKRSEEIIIPCLANFASATTDDSLWKQFSYAVLMKTRHPSSWVRLTALETVCAFATQLGDNFLPFLPETVPFLAELLEDENERVEKQAHKSIQRLERVLGEPIQKYF